MKQGMRDIDTPFQSAFCGLRNTSLPDRAIGPLKQMFEPLIAITPGLFRLPLRRDVLHHPFHFPTVRSQMRDGGLFVHPAHLLALDYTEDLLIAGQPTLHRVATANFEF